MDRDSHRKARGFLARSHLSMGLPETIPFDILEVPGTEFKEKHGRAEGGKNIKAVKREHMVS